MTRAWLVVTGAPRALAVVTLVTIALALPMEAAGAPGGAGPYLGSCGLPETTPVWVDYGEGNVRPDVRDVLAQPGVVIASSGTALPASYRSKGAATTHFVLHLPRHVGTPQAPADPASIPAAAQRLLDNAHASTGCETPWITLNELFGAGAAAPWAPATAQYRANVLTLMQLLAAGGAYPFLLVHGSPTVAGATADWWREIAQAGDIVYEAYYNAANISALGPVLGNRRVRLGMRSFVSQFTSIGIPAGRLGFMLGFHSARTPGIGGRQSLQPREEWLRVVKWQALAARQIALDHATSSIWSWGWGTFGPGSVDPDKAAAACVWLWARDSTLCDGPAVGGSGFVASLAEGQILLGEAYCAFPDGSVRATAVEELAALAGDRHAAVTALVARALLASAVPVTDEQVLDFERRAVARAFDGNQAKYERALTRRKATVAIARGIIRDELRRRAIRSMLAKQGSNRTTLEFTADYGTKASDNLICRRDDLPGYGYFPASNAREIDVVPLPARLRFLFDDRTPPAAPAGLSATSEKGAVSLAWTYGQAPDLAGYKVFRAAVSGGPYVRLKQIPYLIPRTTFVDTTAPTGQPSYYIVSAVDTSGNESAPTPEVAAAPGEAPPPDSEPEPEPTEEP